MRRRTALFVAAIGCLMVPACTRPGSDAAPAPGNERTDRATPSARSGPAIVVTTTSAPLSTPAATSSTTTTVVTTTTAPTTTTSTTTTTLPPAPLTALETTLVVGEDPRRPVTAAIPATEDRPEVDDLLASWLAVTRSEFELRADEVIRARDAEAARLAVEAEAARVTAETAARAAEAAAVASSLPPPTTTTTTTLPPSPPPPPPELSIAHGEPEVRRHHTTLRMTTTRLLDGPVEVATTALHALHDRRVVSSLAWLDPTRLPALADLVRAELGEKAAPGIESLLPRDLFGDVDTDGSGGIVIRLSSSHTNGGGPDTVVVSAAAASEFLSPLGRALASGQPPPRRDAVADCEAEACIALTFDDGPGDHTERLLDVLDRADARATFLLLGREVERRPDVARRIAEDGHEIGNHSWNHDDLRRLEPDDLVADVARTDAAILAATGQEASFIRPPFGAYDLTVRQLERGFLLWDVDPRDWRHREPFHTVDISLRQAAPGSIVVLHDVHAATVDAAPLLIAGLRAAGYRLVTASELIPTIEPGTVYLSQSDQIERPPTTTTTTTTTTTAPATTVGS